MDYDTEYKGIGFKRFWRRLLAVVIFASGLSIGAAGGVYTMQKEAIKHEAAMYDAKTGSWGWVTIEAKIANQEKAMTVEEACSAMGDIPSKDKNGNFRCKAGIK